MAFVYLKTIRADGTIADQMIPLEQIKRVRDLNQQELAFKEQFRDGDFEPANVARRRRRDEANEMRFKGIFHSDAKSALETVTGETHYMLQTVAELAARQPDVILLNADVPIEPARPGAPSVGTASALRCGPMG